MLFNSIDFALFLPIVFLLYWFVFQKNLRLQNALLVIASYVFYGWWDWRFLSLILFSTILDYYIGNAIHITAKKQQRKFLLAISILVNLGFLGFFKYYNFFVDNFIAAFSFFGTSIQPNTLNIILPVGISFYTFQTLSYTIDVYRGNLKPTKNFIAFSAFVCFFPQLVAGPIERATKLLPQFYTQRKFNYANAVDGLRQILWGLFKKIVIADNCAQFANEIFNNSADQNGSTLLLGALFFTFQIYGDFSGYSDIAIGTSRLFGFNLMQNFAYPYFSRNMAEFWRRWHISLSTWFRDYLYIPLGGSRGGMWLKVRNTFIIFIVSGFWHGANWTFIVWGALNAIYFLPILLTNNNRNYLNTVAEEKVLPSLKELLQMLSTFLLAVLAWIFFRAENIQHALNILNEIFSISILRVPKLNFSIFFVIQIIGLLVLFIIVEWQGRNHAFALERFAFKKSKWLRRLCYVAIVLLISLFIGNEQEFIYFKF